MPRIASDEVVDVIIKIAKFSNMAPKITNMTHKIIIITTGVMEIVK